MLSDLSVLGISGSLRRASFNSGLLRAAVELRPSSTEYTAFDLGGHQAFRWPAARHP
jgi:NAD(P)H-dependent FMN reductase